MGLTLWAGKGTWEGWKIRKQYQGCKFGESILIDPDGVPYTPNDILSKKNQNEAKSENKSIKE